MARITQLVCDRCGAPDVTAELRLVRGDGVSVADLCDSCATQAVDATNLRQQAKRGRKAK